MYLNLKNLIKKLNTVSQRSMECSVGFCLSLTHYTVEIEHVLSKLMESEKTDFNIILSYYHVDFDRFSDDIRNSLEYLKTGNLHPPVLSQWIIEWFREAWLLATIHFNDHSIRTGYLLLALLKETQLQRVVSGFSSQLKKIQEDDFLINFSNILINSCENNSIERTEKKVHMPALEQFTIDLTEQARQGKIDRVIGRDEEIRQLIDILTRRRQNNPILTGEPGVGKTAIVEGFALRIVQGDVPPSLKSVSLRILDLALLQAGAGVKGEFESRLKSVIKDVNTSSQPIILFIDEAHTLVGNIAGSANDAANILKPVLARGELRTIGATTWAEYKKYFEQDAALTRRFQVVKVEEPTEETAIHMLRGLVENLELHHGVRILDEAIIAAVHLSHRYLSCRQLPDKAISILDTACSRLSIREKTLPALLCDKQHTIAQLTTEIALLTREEVTGVSHKQRLKLLQEQQALCEENVSQLETRWKEEKDLIDKIKTLNKQLEKQDNVDLNVLKKLKKQLKKSQGELPLLQAEVDAQSIAEVIGGWTGIPMGRILGDEIREVLALESSLQERIIGQAQALKTIRNHIYTAKAQLSDPRKPIGVFLFLGPSGVGKTETAFALAERLYGGEQNMTIINLSEFKEEHKVSLLLGSPPGYVGYGEGGILTEAVRRRPYSLVLLDEVEKAHPGVQDIFYQAFDKGILKDGQGRDIDFKNTVIILTSNIGSELLTNIRRKSDVLPTQEELVALLRPELLKVFKAAFLGRVVVVPYFSLCDDVVQSIIKLQLQHLNKRIQDNHQAQFSYTEAVVKYLHTRCQDSDSGARNIEHFLNKSILPELSLKFLTAMAEGKAIRQIQLDIDDSDSLLMTCI